MKINRLIIIGLLSFGISNSCLMASYDEKEFNHLASSNIALQKLLDSGIDPNTIYLNYGPSDFDQGFKESLLGQAATYGNTDVVQALINAGADLNKKNGNRMKPMFNAIWQGNIGALQCLLDAGADNSIQGGPYGDTTPLGFIKFSLRRNDHYAPNALSASQRIIYEQMEAMLESHQNINTMIPVARPITTNEFSNYPIAEADLIN